MIMKKSTSANRKNERELHHRLAAVAPVGPAGREALGSRNVILAASHAMNSTSAKTQDEGRAHTADPDTTRRHTGILGGVSKECPVLK